MCFPHKEDEAGSTPAVTTMIVYIVVAACIFFAGLNAAKKAYSEEGSFLIGLGAFVLALVTIIVGLRVYSSAV